MSPQAIGAQCLPERITTSTNGLECWFPLVMDHPSSLTISIVLPLRNVSRLLIIRHTASCSSTVLFIHFSLLEQLQVTSDESSLMGYFFFKQCRESLQQTPIHPSIHPSSISFSISLPKSLTNDTTTLLSLLRCYQWLSLILTMYYVHILILVIGVNIVFHESAYHGTTLPVIIIYFGFD